MARTRSELHVRKLDDFVAYLEANGWAKVPTKGPYEVVRLRHPSHKSGGPVIVYTKTQTLAGGPVQHLTIYGQALAWWNRYRRERRRPKPPTIQDDRLADQT